MAVCVKVTAASLYRLCAGCCLVAQLCLTLCNLIDCSPPGSSVPGILQAGILQWVAISSFRESSQPRDQTHISCIGRWVLYHWATWKAPFLPSPLLQLFLYLTHTKWYFIHTFLACIFLSTEVFVGQNIQIKICMQNILYFICVFSPQMWDP